MLIVSSIVMSLDDLLSLDGNGGDDESFPGGVTERRDLRELFDGVRYGVSCGVGREAAADGRLYSSSVSHTAILVFFRWQLLLLAVATTFQGVLLLFF